MPIEIPGYYFDAARNKYFKIERTQTAPSSAQWSAESVKRRKIEEQGALAEARRKQLLRLGIRKHEGLRGDVLVGGLLARECEGGRAGMVAGHGASWWGIGRGQGDGAEVRAEAWARGIVDRGAVGFVPGSRQRGGRMMRNMSCFCVVGEGAGSEVGVVYGTVDETVLLGTHLEPDADGRIGGREQEIKTMGRLGTTWAPVAELVRCPQMSSVAYHEPSHQMLLTSRDPEENGGLFMFSPPTGTTIDDREHWLLGQAHSYQRIAIRPRSQPHNIIHKCTPAPPSSPLLCLVGTNEGILSVNPNGTTTSLSSSSSSSSSHPPSSFAGKHRPGARRHTDGIGEIFDQAFSPTNHHIALVGGRRPRFWLTDLRAPASDWTFVNTESSVTHIRSLNEHQVLAAGLRNSMNMYDLRFVAASRGLNRFKPLLRFPEHKNAAHVHTGFDACADLGLVAAAQDDGTVRLFSLRSGRALPPGGRDALRCAVRSETPLRALQFQTLPGERAPSLFVAEGMDVRKFSFARGAFDE